MLSQFHSPGKQRLVPQPPSLSTKHCTFCNMVLKEMQRFLPAATVRDTLAQPPWWQYLARVIEDQERLALAAL